MAAFHHPGADLAPRQAARHAALKDEDPGLAGVGVFKSVEQNSRLAPREYDSGQPAMVGQQFCKHSLIGAGALMTTREIAALTGKRHDNVMRDARAMLVELHGDGGVLSFEAPHRDPQNGQTYPMLALPKRECLILVSGYSVTMRAKIIDRWQELEHSATPLLPDFSNPAAAARAWADQHELRQHLEVANRQQAEALALAAPKACALDRIATTTAGALSLRETAKLAQVPERQFIEFLSAQGWIFKHRNGGKWMGRSDKEAAGLLELKRLAFQRPDGTEGVEVQVLVTPRGLARLGELIERTAPHLRKAPAKPPGQQDQLVLCVAPVDGQPVEGNP